MKLKSIAAAAALVLAATGAQAQSSTDLGALGVGSTTTFSFSQAANFLNFDVLFTLVSPGTTGSVAAANAGTINFSGSTISMTSTPVTVAGNLYDATNTQIGFDSDLADGFTFSSLLAGSQYRLNLSSAPVQGATFMAGGGAIAVTTAVPEPETYAMFLAGLGAVGFMSRRRKSA